MVISRKPLHFIATLLLLAAPMLTIGQTLKDSAAVGHQLVETKEAATEGSEDKNSIKAEIKEFIGHHLLDSHDFHLYSYVDDAKEEHHIGFPLPVIIWDDGLHIFSSSAFHHGEKAAESKGNFYRLHHEKIYKVANAEAEVAMDAKGHGENQVLDFSITKNVFVIFIIAFLMVLLFVSLGNSYKKNNGIAKGTGRFFEPIVLYIRDEIAIPNIGEKHYKKYMSYLLTIFFFVWFSNIFGLAPLGINLTGNIAITACLAILTYIITTFTANKNYWGHIFWMPGVPWPMKIILAPIELLGTIIKPFSLMIRLYANIVAGHVVLMSIIGLMFIFKNWIGSPLSFLLAFALSLLEILVALLQAYIFTMLSALYFGAGNEEHDHADHH